MSHVYFYFLLLIWSLKLNLFFCSLPRMEVVLQKIKAPTYRSQKLFGLFSIFDNFHLTMVRLTSNTSKCFVYYTTYSNSPEIMPFLGITTSKMCDFSLQLSIRAKTEVSLFCVKNTGQLMSRNFQ